MINFLRDERPDKSCHCRKRTEQIYYKWEKFCAHGFNRGQRINLRFMENWIGQEVISVLHDGIMITSANLVTGAIPIAPPSSVTCPLAAWSNVSLCPWSQLNETETTSKFLVVAKTEPKLHERKFSSWARKKELCVLWGWQHSHTT